MNQNFGRELKPEETLGHALGRRRILWFLTRLFEAMGGSKEK